MAHKWAQGTSEMSSWTREEKRQIKDLKTDLQLLKSKHKRLKEERDSLLENMQSSKRTYSQRILTCLINSGKEKYISYLNGREVMNRMAINTPKKSRRFAMGLFPGQTTTSKNQFENTIHKRSSRRWHWAQVADPIWLKNSGRRMGSPFRELVPYARLRDIRYLCLRHQRKDTKGPMR